MDNIQIKQDLIKLMERHKGHNNAISAKELSEQLDISSRELRELSGDIVKDGSALMGSSPDYGFFMIVDEEDYNLAIRHIESRICALAERKRALMRMWEEKSIVSFDEARKIIRAVY